MAQVLPSPPPGRTIRGKVKDHKVLTGVICEILLRGVPIGRATGLNFQQNFGTQPVNEIGTMMPAEFPPGQWVGRLTIEKLALREDAVARIVGTYSEEILFMEIFDIQVRNRADNTIKRTYQGLVPDNNNQNIRVGQPVQEGYSFFVADVVGPDGTSQIRESNSAAGSGLGV